PAQQTTLGCRWKGRPSKEQDLTEILWRFVLVVLILQIAQRGQSSVNRESGQRSFPTRPSGRTPHSDRSRRRLDRFRREPSLRRQARLATGRFQYWQPAPAPICGRGACST